MIRDRVQQTSTTSGTGTLSLDGGAIPGFLAFASVFANNDKVYFTVIDGNAWEVIEGVFQSGAPPTLTRVRTLASSNGGSPVSFTGSAKQVFSGIPAELLGPVQGRLKSATASNVGNAYALTLPVPIPSLIDWLEFGLRVNAGNSGAVTLAVNGLTAKPLRKLQGLPLNAGDLKPGQILDLRYDAGSDAFLWLNAPACAGAKSVSAATYTALPEDSGVLLRFTNAGGCAVTLPQATSSFAPPWAIDLQNGSTGTVTVTPTVSLIDGAANLALGAGQGMRLVSDGTNYLSQRGGAGLVLAASLPVSSKSATYTMLAADRGSEISFTTAGVTLNLLAAASAGNGALLAIRNAAASGDVTLDPAGSETLDGLATRLLRPGDNVLIRSDGVNWRTVSGTYSFESAEQVPALGTLYTVAHGLGEKPTDLMVICRCIVAELGWAVGDEVILSAHELGTSYGSNFVANAANVHFFTQQTYQMPAVRNPTTPAANGSYITTSKWRYVVKAQIRKG